MKFQTVKFNPAPGDRSPTGLPVYELISIPANVNIKKWIARLEELGCCGICVGYHKQPQGYVKLNFWASPEAVVKLQQAFSPEQPKQLTLL
jgi:hypothetical protein